MFASVDTTRLAVFRQVVTCGSFTAAAAALGISQPAVSQHIARLEQEVGMQLLDRAGRGMRITYPGKVLLHHTEGLLSHLREATRELTALAHPDGGEVRMVTFPSAAATIVPPVVGTFRRALPKAKVLLSEADPAVALPRLLMGDADLALVYDYPAAGEPRDPRLRWEVVADDRMAVVLPAGHPLAATAEVPLAALAGEQWIAPNPCPCLDAFVGACRGARFDPDIVSMSNDYAAMIGLVSAGIGVAVVPRIMARAPLPATVAVRPLRDARISRSIAAVTRTTGYQPPATDRLVATLREELARLAVPGLQLDVRTAAELR
ncbi:LysR family transcriptional regulator [Amycolatopsis mongoliensis]|uniref:LysR family transcriptional regulator n=1 Tax=Amycolatopsis mongoliensis TaxID=715475 RepID=A0A9Y2JJK8_9PSEU|nr:LysR family transcriptional regulator [Amycolatopsis sp. 4-36]WIX98493.1 LysR family transcriptional regulator [Amycolatopsis sp. 4-36]